MPIYFSSGCFLAVSFMLLIHVSSNAQSPSVTKQSIYANNQAIPLTSTVTTSPQPGLLQTRHRFPLSSKDRQAVIANRFLRHILQSTRGGSSNVFLVDAQDAREAIAASLDIITGTRTTDTPASASDSEQQQGNYWLAAYLGLGPGGSPRWEIESIKVATDTITLTYHESDTTTLSHNDIRYFYWVPLGKLQPAAYQVELFDSQSNATTLMRRIQVGQ